MKGGTDRILSAIWTNIIDDFKSLEHLLTFVVNSNVPEDELATFHAQFGPDVSPESLVTQFLSGSGIPDEAMWADLTGEGQLQELPSRHDMDKPSFRARMLTWAMTGSPHLPTGPMQVSNSLYDLCA